jgi:hypothetical protein
MVGCLIKTLSICLLVVMLRIAGAAEPAPGAVVWLDTRSVRLPVYAVWRDDAVATLVIYSGGAGGYGRIGDDGWPGSSNFLVRSARQFAAQRFNVLIVGRASDVRELDGAARVSEQHGQDNQAVLRYAQGQRQLPVWLVGTSMGTISVAAAAIRDTSRAITGIVLTSSVTAWRITGAVPTQDLASIRLPVLVLHHARDACKVCAPWEAARIAAALTSAPVRKTIMVQGGSDPTGDPCEPWHHHGFVGQEQLVVDTVSDWIRRPVN